MKFCVLLLALFLTIAMAASARAEEDCNSKCCKFGLCEPACKLACEANKKVGLPQIGPPGPGDVQKALTMSCAAGFEVINKGVIVSQGFYAAGTEQLLNQAKTVLINSGVIAPAEFDGVNIRWAKLYASTQGQAADAGSS